MNYLNKILMHLKIAKTIMKFLEGTVEWQETNAKEEWNIIQ